MSINHGVVHKTKRDALFALLKDLSWHPNWELKEHGGVRYSARLLELKRMGFDIEDRVCRDDTGGKEYRLRTLAQGPPKKKKLVKVYLDEDFVHAMVHTKRVPRDAIGTLRKALSSFRNNKHKL